MTNIAGNKSFFLLPTIHHEAHRDWQLVPRSRHKRACPYVRHSKIGPRSPHERACPHVRHGKMGGI